MNGLDSLYIELLKRGFIMLQQASDSGNAGWLKAEVEMLHNVPSLIGEALVGRHKYYLDCEQAKYTKWVALSGSERIKSKVKAYYDPVWGDIEKIIQQIEMSSS